MGAFGEKLRKQREQRGIELDAISNTTKISTRMLRAIEEEHFDQLPGGVFNKGFVRAYARQVGLDEEEAITDYLAALRESQIQAQTVPPNFRTQTGTPAPEVREPDRRNHDPDRNGPPHNLHKNDLRENDLLKNDSRKNDLGHNNGRSSELRRNENHQPVPRRNADRRREDRRNQARNMESRSNEARSGENLPVTAAPPSDDSTTSVPWGKLAVALLLLTLALAFLSLLRRGQPTSASQAAASSHPSPAQPAAAPASAPTQSSATKTALTAGKALYTGTLVTATTPSPNTAPTLAGATALKPSQPAPSITLSTSKAAASSSPDSGNNLSDDSPGDDNPPVAKSFAHTSAANAPPTFTLLIRAAETSWVSIIADGQPRLRETLIAPANTSVRATREIVVHAGNAGGISFLLNGKEVEAPGSEGEVRTYTFDSTGLKVSAATQSPDPAR